MLIKKVILSATVWLNKTVSVRTLMSMTGHNVIFPFYHTVSDNHLAHIHHLYNTKTIKQFTNDLDFFLKYYKPLDVSDIITYRNNGKISGKPGFFLTFDDGLSQFYDIICPILLQKGIPAVCFLNSAFVDNKDFFFRYKASLLLDHFFRNQSECKKPEVMAWAKQNGSIEPKKALLSIPYNRKEEIDILADIVGRDFCSYLSEVKPYMTSDQIRVLSEKGFYFGAHSIDHPDYQGLSEEEQINQSATSLKWVVQNFQQKYSLFAFPYTDFGVKTSFFKHFDKTDLIFGTAGIKNDPVKNVFQRIPMEVNQFNAETIIKSEYLYYSLKSLAGKNDIQRND